MRFIDHVAAARRCFGKARPILLAAALSSALAGCFGESVIDARSGDALKESVAEISHDLSPAESKRFLAAIKVLVDAQKGDGRSMDEIAERLGPQIGGRTAAEVIAAGEALAAAERKRVAELERKRRLKDLQSKIGEYTAEIERLETLIVEQAQKAQIVRASFALSGARYFWRESNAETFPLIDVEIANNHDQPIRTVVINARLSEPQGGKTIVEGKLRYEFRANLQPGARATMRFEPDVFGDWGNEALKDRDDLVLSADVENLTYPDGAELVRTFIVRGEDPEFQLKSLRRRESEARAALEGMQPAAGGS